MAIWYSAGSVSLTNNSPTVTGVGTQFTTNVRVGDAFYHNGLTYEVTNVASETVVSIKPNYVGAPVSAQPYSIAPIQGYVKESADRLRSVSMRVETAIASVDASAASAAAALVSKNAAAASAAAALASKNAAATSETNANTSKNTATTKASEASTSATNAASSATTATTKATAAGTSETNAAASAASALSNKNASDTAKTAAETAKTAAEAAKVLAESAKTSAQTSATNAATSATTATTKASEASTSATNAAASATAASGSASSASTNAATVATTTARFLTPKSSVPATRDGGGALQVGDRYYNTSTQLEYIYKASGWVVNEAINAISSVNGKTGATITLTTNDVAEGSTNKYVSAAQKTKIDGVASGATINQTDAYLVNRGNHTGSQATSTITGLDTALTNKQPLNTNLTALSGLGGAADKLPYFTGAGALALTTLTSPARSLLAAASPAEQRSVLGSLREVLTASRTYYVRTDGSDSNTGLSNTPEGAFLTIQKAVDTACTLDASSYAVIIQLAGGTYSGQVVLKSFVGSSKFIIRGNVSDYSLCIIESNTVTIFSGAAAGWWSILGVHIKSTSGNYAISPSGAGTLLELTNFGVAGNYGLIQASGQAKIKITGNWYITSGAIIGLAATSFGLLECYGSTLTYLNSPNFTARGWQSVTQGQLNCYSMTFVNGGTVTGKRYIANDLSSIFTNGAGDTYLPGTIAGTTSGGGQYV